jgi:hypothetical protein
VSLKTGRRVIIISLLALLLIIVAIPLGTMGAEAPPLAFVTLTKQPEATPTPNGNTRIQVVTNKPVVSIEGLSSADQSLLESVDYSQYFIVVTFTGYGTLLGEGIANIWQFRDAIWVRSVYSTAAETATIRFTPYQIVRIEKSQLHVYGNIIFRLFNGYDQKAETVQTILDPTR